jgi:hypothetical protein
MIDYSLEHLFSYTVTLDQPEVIGPVPEGILVNFHFTGGEVNGPRVHGKVRPVGADWLTIRPDGVGILDVRATIETQDEALLYSSYTGVGELGEDGYDNFLQGVLPQIVPVRVVPRILTSHPDYQWLNRLQCLGVGEIDVPNLKVGYDLYAVR